MPAAPSESPPTSASETIAEAQKLVTEGNVDQAKAKIAEVLSQKATYLDLKNEEITKVHSALQKLQDSIKEKSEYAEVAAEIESLQKAVSDQVHALLGPAMDPSQTNEPEKPKPDLMEQFGDIIHKYGSEIDSGLRALGWVWLANQLLSLKGQKPADAPAATSPNAGAETPAQAPADQPSNSASTTPSKPSEGTTAAPDALAQLKTQMKEGIDLRNQPITIDGSQITLEEGGIRIDKKLYKIETTAYWIPISISIIGAKRTGDTLHVTFEGGGKEVPQAFSLDAITTIVKNLKKKDSQSFSADGRTITISPA